jgi:hypothetical protein
LQFSAKAAIQTASMMFSILRRKVAMLAVADTRSTRAVDVLGRVISEAYAMCQKFGPTGSEYNDDLYRKYLRLRALASPRPRVTQSRMTLQPE